MSTTSPTVLNSRKGSRLTLDIKSASTAVASDESLLKSDSDFGNSSISLDLWASVGKSPSNKGLVVIISCSRISGKGMSISLTS